MKVLFLSRTDLYKISGGDTIQMNLTKEYIERLNPDIHIDISCSIKPDNINEYDIVHLFNLDWVSETYVNALWAKKHNKILVLSAIHHSEKEVKLFEDKSRFDIRRLVNLLVKSQEKRDMLKNVYRSIFDYTKVYPTVIQLRKGLRNEQKDILKMCDITLVQTEKEAMDISHDFGMKKLKYKIVYNAVNTEKFVNASPNKFLDYMKSNYGVNNFEDKIILNVGRIEPRKNQLKLIEAFNILKSSFSAFRDWKLIFIGGITKYHPEYKMIFNRLLRSSKDVYYLGIQNQEFIASCMACKGIYVQPSWFETTGLVTLEGYISGMKVVASGDRIKEYLLNNASYCKPDSLDSIVESIKEAYNKNINKTYLKQAISKFSWENTAKQTAEIYRELLKV